MNMEEAHNKENGEKAENDSADDAIWRTTVCNQFADDANKGGNKNLDEKLCQRYVH